MPDNIPDEAPPPYEQAAGSSSKPNQDASGHLAIPGSSSSHGGIPPASRRSMEDEGRSLPEGWVRTFDPKTQHQFFVDTRKDPARSIWVHPYDDEEYLSTLSGEERERIEQESMGRGHPMSKADMMAEHTDESEAEESHHPGLPPRPDDKGKGKKPLGRKIKDKLTGTTHEEREQERRKREQRDRDLYARHVAIRSCMAKAAQTGQPQLLGKDSDGKDIYVEPPAYQGGFGYPGGYGYNPYARGGIYTTPNARYVRPPAPYARSYGMGYGGGYGLPLALGGGLLGGALLGGAMGGF
ncbi:hypothetical protein KC356_g6173 [Hortaea werneckii]|nr:hypothetical protein KC356_g6173 [Hortaea werneckii]